MVGKLFLEKLLLKLKTGDARSIHLNALPGRFARLDLYDLVNIDPSLHLKFLRQLLTRTKFDFQISIDFKEVQKHIDHADERVIIAKNIARKLNGLYYQQMDDFLEHGTQTFAFGYPLLIKRDALHPEKILKAPLIIWYLDLQKEIHKGNTWRISRNEDHPVIFNEVLRSHLETNDRIKSDDLLGQLDEQPISEQQLVQICQVMLEKLGTTSTDFDTELKVLPGTNKESIEKLTGHDAWIRWSGIFGLYKTQKQSIIRDVEMLINEPSILDENPKNEESDDLITTIHSAVELDPSQEAILNGLKKHEQIIIQGPPGTGKSQSLTAVISNSLINSKTCLVVCEKKTALDVIYQNLAKTGLQDFCIIIEDVYRDRKKVVDRVRQLLETRDDMPNDFRAHDFAQMTMDLESNKDDLSNHLYALNQRCFGDDSIAGLIGQVQQRKSSSSWKPLLFSNETPILNPGYEEYIFQSAVIKQGSGLFTHLPGPMSYDRMPDRHFSNGQSTQFLFEDISLMREHLRKIEETFVTEIDQSKDTAILFNDLKRINNWKLIAGSIISPVYRRMKTSRQLVRSQYVLLVEYFSSREYFDFQFPELHDAKQLDVIRSPLIQLTHILEEFENQSLHFNSYCNWRSFTGKQDQACRVLLRMLSARGTFIDPIAWPVSYEIWYKQTFINDYLSTKDVRSGLAEMLDETASKDDLLMKEVPRKCVNVWEKRQKEVFRNRTISGIKNLYNYRRNKQYGRRNSLRKIINQDLELFTTAFPIVMVNPVVCSSILPLEKDIFDHVIFDESSQLRIEDTFAALIRGRYKIISGDKHQMPPSSYFTSNLVLVDDQLEDPKFEDDEVENVNDDYLADSTSLLEYGMDTDYKPEYLDFHYRSLHPDLISFSNAAFYGNRLVAMPAMNDEPPIEFVQVDGSYNKTRTNPNEAEAIAQYIFETIEENENGFPSVGIATFNINQRNYIWDLLMEKTYSNPDYARKLDGLIENGLFVKNLENIQGDERDIILISTTFGPASDGKFRQSFGPISQETGYRLLNVIISRAKYKVAVFTSIPTAFRARFKDSLDEKGNTGKGIFYSYLAYAEAVAMRDKKRIKNIVDLVSGHCTEKPYLHELKAMPLFLQLIYSGLFERFGKDGVVHNLQLGGFLLELVIMKNNQPAVALLTSQLAHPGDTSYRMYLFKEKILKQHQIPSYKVDAIQWFRDWKSEEERLYQFIDERL